MPLPVECRSSAGRGSLGGCFEWELPCLLAVFASACGGGRADLSECFPDGSVGVASHVVDGFGGDAWIGGE